MCELLVRVSDKVNEDFYRNCQCTKRGDIISLCPDGWNWSTSEKTVPFWRIVKLPNVTVAQATPYLRPEIATDPLNPSKTLQKRAFKLDLSNATLPAAFITFIQDNTRAQPSYTFNASAATIASIVVLKSPITDPAILGGSHAVVG